MNSPAKEEIVEEEPQAAAVRRAPPPKAAVAVEQAGISSAGNVYGGFHGHGGTPKWIKMDQNGWFIRENP